MNTLVNAKTVSYSDKINFTTGETVAKESLKVEYTTATVELTEVMGAKTATGDKVYDFTFTTWANGIQEVKARAYGVNAFMALQKLAIKINQKFSINLQPVA